MRVLHVLQSPKISGAENVVADICMMFKGEHEMIYCSPDGSIRHALADRGVEYLPLGKLNKSEVRRAIRLSKPDIIHAHDVSATVISSIVAGRIPLVSHLHVNAEDMRKITLKSTLYALAARKAKQIIAVSESCFQEYTFRNIILSKTTSLTNIIYTPRIKKLINKDTNEYSHDFVYFGRLSEQKNPIRVARVASETLKLIPTAIFGVIGEGSLKPEMEAVFQKEGIINRVVFTGRLAYPYKALKRAKCMLMCSHYEGTPIAALEAMALGVPIVSTPVDGMKELVDNGKTGYLLSEDKDLVNAVNELIVNKKKQNKMSCGSISRFKSLNNTDSYKNLLGNIYNNMC